MLVDLVPKYFDPEAVAAVAGHREETTELLKLPFDFIFFTGSTSTGKVVARAAAENLDAGPSGTRRPESRAGRRDRQHPGRGQEDCLGRDGLGRAMVHSPGYAYVHESIAEQFVAEAKAALIGLFGEDPKSNPDYSRIISAREVSASQV